MQVYKSENSYGVGEVRSWASLIDENCLDQAKAISRVPILEGYLALMPDAHHGFGPPVGSALLTRNAVMPYAVGVDIGCGMIAVKTDIDRERLIGSEQGILRNLREYIPSGVGRAHLKISDASTQFFNTYGLPPGLKLLRQGAEQVARQQFGTLGSGNHFVEVCEELPPASNKVWFVLHSGSRGIGNQLATAHVRLAQANQVEPIESKEFAWFDRDTPYYDEYLSDMLWAQKYAFEQREAMMAETIRAVVDATGIDSLDILQVINCHHNYAEEIEPGLWLTRKGAINAGPNQMGVIPGSMGAATYIVRGLGNSEAYNTSPHGAGRLLGRNVAKKSLSLDEFKTQMEGKTWLHNDASTLLDEAPHAYKPIETVIRDSESLIDPVTILSQFINYKGL